MFLCQFFSSFAYEALFCFSLLISALVVYSFKEIDPLLGYFYYLSQKSEIFFTYELFNTSLLPIFCNSHRKCDRKKLVFNGFYCTGIFSVGFLSYERQTTSILRPSLHYNDSERLHKIQLKNHFSICLNL